MDSTAFGSLRGKTGIITGGCSGIGLATVRLLLELGMNVVAADINPPPLDQEPSENYIFVKTDVTRWEELSAVFETANARYGNIDCVFANAGT